MAGGECFSEVPEAQMLQSFSPVVALMKDLESNKVTFMYGRYDCHYPLIHKILLNTCLGMTICCIWYIIFFMCGIKVWLLEY